MRGVFITYIILGLLLLLCSVSLLFLHFEDDEFIDLLLYMDNVNVSVNNKLIGVFNSYTILYSRVVNKIIGVSYSYITLVYEIVYFSCCLIKEYFKEHLIFGVLLSLLCICKIYIVLNKEEKEEEEKIKRSETHS